MFIDNKEYLTVSEFEDCTNHGFSTRAGGVSDGIYSTMNFRFNCDDLRENVLKNFEIFCGMIGADYKSLVLTNQVHEDNVIRVGRCDAGCGIHFPNKFESADALITNERKLPLAVFWADCVPIMFLDKKKKAIGVAHSGWRGTYLGISAKTVLRMREEFLSNSEDIIAAIGPSVMDCHYEVSDELGEMFLSRFGEDVLEKKEGKYHLSLQRTIKKQLLEVGVKNQVYSKICTYCESDRFFSHRKTNGKRGVMAGIIELK